MNKKEIIKYIKQLCNQEPLKYLELSSKWFMKNFTDINHKDVYPYYDSKYNNFFFNENIKPFQKDVILKFIINQDMNDSSKDIEKISSWIVKSWGGIRGIKNTTIEKIVNEINETNYLFENISSWSKIHSFKDIYNNVIYDSKVIYSINWILLKLESELKIKNCKFFLQPSTRNRKLSTFSIEQIINYIHSNEFDFTKKGEKVNELVYLKKLEVYSKYKNLIKEINLLIWEDETINLTKLIEKNILPKDYPFEKNIILKNYPFFTEMLLFNMSDDIIYKDIINHINIIIK
jgi:hypothetical protein